MIDRLQVLVPEDVPKRTEAWRGYNVQSAKVGSVYPAPSVSTRLVHDQAQEFRRSLIMQTAFKRMQAISATLRIPWRVLDVFSFAALIVFLASFALILRGHQLFRQTLFSAVLREHLDLTNYSSGNLYMAEELEAVEAIEPPRRTSTYDYSPMDLASTFELAFRFRETEPLADCETRAVDPDIANIRTTYPEFSSPILPALQHFHAKDDAVIESRCRFEASLRKLSAAFLEFFTPLETSDALSKSVIETERNRARELESLLREHSELEAQLLAAVKARTDAAQALEEKLSAIGVKVWLEEPQRSTEPRWLIYRGSVFDLGVKNLVSSCEAKFADPGFLSTQEDEESVLKRELRQYYESHPNEASPGLDMPPVAITFYDRSRHPWRPLEYMVEKRCVRVDVGR